MTTAQIETYADIGGIAQPDVDLKIILRRKVVPEFLRRVGYPSWRRKNAAISLVASTQEYDLPDDFGSMKSLSLNSPQSSTVQYTELTYIGDDPMKVVLAAGTVTAAKPTGYYFVRRATTELFKRLRFNCPPDLAYTCRYVYNMNIVFADDTTSVEIDKYVPAEFQWGLVEGLKAYLYGVRRGLGDARKEDAETEFAKFIALAAENQELSAQVKPKFVD